MLCHAHFSSMSSLSLWMSGKRGGFFAPLPRSMMPPSVEASSVLSTLAARPLACPVVKPIRPASNSTRPSVSQSCCALLFETRYATTSAMRPHRVCSHLDPVVERGHGLSSQPNPGSKELRAEVRRGKIDTSIRSLEQTESQLQKGLAQFRGRDNLRQEIRVVASRIYLRYSDLLPPKLLLDPEIAGSHVTDTTETSSRCHASCRTAIAVHHDCGVKAPVSKQCFET